MQTSDPRQIAHIVESNEVNMFDVCWRAVSPDFARQHKAYAVKMGGAIVSCFGGLPITAFNRVIGLGVFQPAGEPMIDEIMAIYAELPSPFGISISPAAQPGKIADWLAERGFKQGQNTAKMIRGPETPPKLNTSLRIEPVDESNVQEYCQVAIGGFGMPDWTAPLFEALIHIPGLHAYLAYEGETPVGTGSMYIQGDRAALFNGATLPDHRRKGAQGALMNRRIQDALARGCRWLSTETGEDTEDTPNPSFRNMLRTGFRLAYLRPNYIYEPPA